MLLTSSIKTSSHARLSQAGHSNLPRACLGASYEPSEGTPTSQPRGLPRASLTKYTPEAGWQNTPIVFLRGVRSIRRVSRWQRVDGMGLWPSPLTSTVSDEKIGTPSQNYTTLLKLLMPDPHLPRLINSTPRF